MNPLVMLESPQSREERYLKEALVQNPNWKDKYRHLLEMVDCGNPDLERRARNTFAIMKNQADLMEAIKQATASGNPQLEATFTNNLPGLLPKVIDLVRIFYPNLISQTLVDMQAMDRQNGEVFIVKPIYSNTAAGVTAGQQVFKNATDGNYASEKVSASLGTGDGAVVLFSGTLAPIPVRPGTVVVTAGAITGTDNGGGAITGSGITGASTINYATGAISVTFAVAPSGAVPVSVVHEYNSEVSADQIRELEIQLGLYPIQAKPHPIRIKYSTTAQLAASAHLNLDVPDTLANLVASFIKYERDLKVINLIVSNATPISDLNFDATMASVNYSKLAKYAEIETKLDFAISEIQRINGRGSINWILAGNNAADLWMKVNGFVASGVTAPIGPYILGSVRDGTVTIVKVPTMNTNTYVVGFKGYSVGDSATILAEWVPLYASPTFNSYDLNNYQGLMSLYALLLQNASYYLKGTISNYGA